MNGAKIYHIKFGTLETSSYFVPTVIMAVRFNSTPDFEFITKLNSDQIIINFFCTRDWML